MSRVAQEARRVTGASGSTADSSVASGSTGTVHRKRLNAGKPLRRAGAGADPSWPPARKAQRLAHTRWFSTTTTSLRRGRDADSWVRPPLASGGGSVRPGRAVVAVRQTAVLRRGPCRRRTESLSDDGIRACSRRRTHRATQAVHHRYQVVAVPLGGTDHRCRVRRVRRPRTSCRCPSCRTAWAASMFETQRRAPARGSKPEPLAVALLPDVLAVRHLRKGRGMSGATANTEQTRSLSKDNQGRGARRARTTRET